MATVSTPRRHRRMAVAVIYERLGTKGLLLDDGRIVRELDRSFYDADVFEPDWSISDGRVLPRIALKTTAVSNSGGNGRPLTASADRKPSDLFHSRLAASPHGKRLLSAGWLCIR